MAGLGSQLRGGDLLAPLSELRAQSVPGHGDEWPKPRSGNALHGSQLSGAALALAEGMAQAAPRAGAEVLSVLVIIESQSGLG